MDKRAWKGGPDGGYRDRLLSFQWQLPPDLIEALRLPTARNGAHEVARRMIVAEALLGAERGQGVSYSRRKLSYSRGKRYRAPAHTYATVLGSVDKLVREGWLADDAGLAVPMPLKCWRPSRRTTSRSARPFAPMPACAWVPTHSSLRTIRAVGWRNSSFLPACLKIGPIGVEERSTSALTVRPQGSSPM
jgi:hypothetical protein